MTKDIEEIRETLKDILKEHMDVLKVRVDKPTNFEVNGTIEAMQGKKKVDGIYFSSVVPKEKDVRLYFFPAYTHAGEYEGLSDQMMKFKKGKSCFHIKKLDDALEQEIKDMVEKGIALYQQDGWLAT